MYASNILYLLAVLVFSCSQPSVNSNSAVQEYKDTGFTITYIANMGVLIRTDKTSVLIDGLHTFYRPAYEYPSDSMINAILLYQGIFNNLGVALFTHHHRDHFSTPLARRFLNASPNNKIAGSQQILDSIASNSPAVINAWNKNNVILNDTVSRLSVTAFDIPHTGRQRHASVQNIAYLVQMDSITVVHIGDADTDVNAFAKLKDLQPNVAVVPLWFLDDSNGKEIISLINPKAVIATHIEPNSSNLNSMRLKDIPTYFFTRPGQFMP